LRECYPDQPLLEIVDQPYDVLNCSSSTASAGADALIVVTAWEIFQSPDYARIRAGLRQPFILDGRNVYNPDYLREQGFTYVGIGRGDVF